MLNGKSILITGGTGSLGQALTKKIFKDYPGVKKLIIFSRDEQKQYTMAQNYPSNEYPAIRFFIGDIRDYNRIKTALIGIDYVIHAAAMKHVPIAEYNPMECVKTNVLGAENLIKASIESSVVKVVALSTDKAAAPINLYGATKLTSDKLFIAANNIKGANPISFSVVRYGNVMGSNGSVIPFFINKSKENELPITNPKMTRFNITIEKGVEMVLHALDKSWGGEIFIPKIPSYNIMDLAKAICPEGNFPIIGVRPGEKIHEEMITSSDSFTSYDLGNYFVILPQNPTWNIKEYIKVNNAKKVKEGFSYDSGTNNHRLSVDEIKRLLIENNFIEI